MKKFYLLALEFIGLDVRCYVSLKKKNPIPEFLNSVNSGLRFSYELKINKFVVSEVCICMCIKFIHCLIIFKAHVQNLVNFQLSCRSVLSLRNFAVKCIMA